MAFGARIIDGEYVSVRELDRITEEKIKAMTAPARSAAPDWTKDTPFEEL